MPTITNINQTAECTIQVQGSGFSPAISLSDIEVQIRESRFLDLMLGGDSQWFTLTDAKNSGYVGPAYSKLFCKVSVAYVSATEITLDGMPIIHGMNIRYAGDANEVQVLPTITSISVDSNGTTLNGKFLKEQLPSVYYNTFPSVDSSFVGDTRMFTETGIGGGNSVLLDRSYNKTTESVSTEPQLDIPFNLGTASDFDAAVKQSKSFRMSFWFKIPKIGEFRSSESDVNNAIRYYPMMTEDGIVNAKIGSAFSDSSNRGLLNIKTNHSVENYSDNYITDCLRLGRDGTYSLRSQAYDGSTWQSWMLHPHAEGNDLTPSIQYGEWYFYEFCMNSYGGTEEMNTYINGIRLCKESAEYNNFSIKNVFNAISDWNHYITFRGKAFPIVVSNFRISNHVQNLTEYPQLIINGVQQTQLAFTSVAYNQIKFKNKLVESDIIEIGRQFLGTDMYASRVDGNPNNIERLYPLDISHKNPRIKAKYKYTSSGNGISNSVSTITQVSRANNLITIQGTNLKNERFLIVPQQKHLINNSLTTDVLTSNSLLMQSYMYCGDYIKNTDTEIQLDDYVEFGSFWIVPINGMYGNRVGLGSGVVCNNPYCDLLEIATGIQHSDARYATMKFRDRTRYAMPNVVYKFNPANFADQYRRHSNRIGRAANDTTNDVALYTRFGREAAARLCSRNMIVTDRHYFSSINDEWSVECCFTPTNTTGVIFTIRDSSNHAVYCKQQSNNIYVGLNVGWGWEVSTSGGVVNKAMNHLVVSYSRLSQALIIMINGQVYKWVDGTLATTLMGSKTDLILGEFPNSTSDSNGSFYQPGGYLLDGWISDFKMSSYYFTEATIMQRYTNFYLTFEGQDTVLGTGNFVNASEGLFRSASQYGDACDVQNTGNISALRAGGAWNGYNTAYVQRFNADCVILLNKGSGAIHNMGAGAQSYEHIPHKLRLLRMFNPYFSTTDHYREVDKPLYNWNSNIRTGGNTKVSDTVGYNNIWSESNINFILQHSPAIIGKMEYHQSASISSIHFNSCISIQGSNLIKEPSYDYRLTADDVLATYTNVGELNSGIWVNDKFGFQGSSLKFNTDESIAIPVSSLDWMRDGFSMLIVMGTEEGRISEGYSYPHPPNTAGSSSYVNDSGIPSYSGGMSSGIINGAILALSKNNTASLDKIVLTAGLSSNSIRLNGILYGMSVQHYNREGVGGEGDWYIAQIDFFPKSRYTDILMANKNGVLGKSDGIRNSLVTQGHGVYRDAYSLGSVNLDSTNVCGRAEVNGVISMHARCQVKTQDTVMDSATHLILNPMLSGMTASLKEFRAVYIRKSRYTSTEINAFMGLARVNRFINNSVSASLNMYPSYIRNDKAVYYHPFLPSMYTQFSSSYTEAVNGNSIEFRGFNTKKTLDLSAVATLNNGIVTIPLGQSVLPPFSVYDKLTPNSNTLIPTNIFGRQLFKRLGGIADSTVTYNISNSANTKNKSMLTMSFIAGIVYSASYYTLAKIDGCFKLECNARKMKLTVYTNEGDVVFYFGGGNGIAGTEGGVTDLGFSTEKLSVLELSIAMYQAESFNYSYTYSAIGSNGLDYNLDIPHGMEVLTVGSKYRAGANKNCVRVSLSVSDGFIFTSQVAGTGEPQLQQQSGRASTNVAAYRGIYRGVYNPTQKMQFLNYPSLLTLGDVGTLTSDFYVGDAYFCNTKTSFSGNSVLYESMISQWHGPQSPVVKYSHRLHFTSMYKYNGSDRGNKNKTNELLKYSISGNSAIYTEDNEGHIVPMSIGIMSYKSLYIPQTLYWLKHQNKWLIVVKDSPTPANTVYYVYEASSMFGIRTQVASFSRPTVYEDTDVDYGGLIDADDEWAYIHLSQHQAVSASILTGEGYNLDNCKEGVLIRVGHSGVNRGVVEKITNKIPRPLSAHSINGEVYIRTNTAISTHAKVFSAKLNGVALPIVNGNYSLTTAQFSQGENIVEVTYENGDFQEFIIDKPIGFGVPFESLEGITIPNAFKVYSGLDAETKRYSID